MSGSTINAHGRALPGEWDDVEQLLALGDRVVSRMDHFHFKAQFFAHGFCALATGLTSMWWSTLSRQPTGREWFVHLPPRRVRSARRSSSTSVSGGAVGQELGELPDGAGGVVILVEEDQPQVEMAPVESGPDARPPSPRPGARPLDRGGLPGLAVVPFQPPVGGERHRGRRDPRRAPCCRAAGPVVPRRRWSTGRPRPVDPRSAVPWTG